MKKASKDFLPDIILNINIFLTIFLRFFAITGEKVTGKGPSLGEGDAHFMGVGLHFVKVGLQREDEPPFHGV
jgi:hypothetical protein